jgi:hypothetical protein
MSDLSAMGINPPATPQTGAPTGAGAPPGAGMGGGRNAGMNPGGIEAAKSAIKQLKSMGLSDEEILQIILDMIENMGGTANEEQIMQMITGVGPGGEAGGAPQGGMPTGGAPPMGGGMPPTQTPMM